MIIKPKGTKDVLPNESCRWQHVEEIMRKKCRLYNIREIRTPAFEHTELFNRSIGEETDVVTKEMYTFLDKKGRSITLKPEGTAPVVRSFIENNLADLSLPLKLYYFTPVFRYEAPQEGRYREHHQFGVEFYGGTSVAVDFEVIYFAYTLIKALGINDVSLRLNSIGCPECRNLYVNALKEYVSSNIQEMCPKCKDRYEKNPLRILDCKENSCRTKLASAPSILEYLCGDCRNHLGELEKLLDRFDVNYALDAGIVRGLDYYNRTVFEFVTSALGSQGTICGGGRYDSLVRALGGADIPCVGFGLGMERLLLLMEKSGVEFSDSDKPDVFICCQSKECFEFCYSLAQTVRDAGFRAEVDLLGKSLKAQMKYADKLGSDFTIVIGETEMQSGKASLKNMRDGSFVDCNIDEIINEIDSRVKKGANHA